ncbi:hypothetical protein PHPALM_31354 [Phytophthora palmivora]|uniref:Uncharacterized protein n=1 Tax=Phytophthora palmivora TaxID=4796 RepID=A0A2P4X2S9_9STRA|nr:hypothetical protein PHPALM_31354 [Phytophthora palmivora]
MNYEYLPSRTYDTKGTRTVWIHNAGAKKKRMTVMLLSDMHGNRKTPFAIFKQPASKVKETEIYNHKHHNGFGRILWSEVAPLINKHKVQIYANGKGENLGEKILLLWDDFSGHWTRPVMEYAATMVLMKILPGYMSSCQPADIAWMKPFKLALRSLWVEHLRCQLRSHRENDTQQEVKLVAPSRTTLMSWLTNAWKRLPITTFKLSIPSDKREFPPVDPVLYEADVTELVDKLESLNLAEEVSEDFVLDTN